MNEKPIKVLIQDGTASSNVASSTESLTPQTAAQNVAPVSTQAANNSMKVKATGIATMVATQSFSYLSSNVGKFTGSSRLQKQVNNGQKAIQIGAMAMINPYVAVATVGLEVGMTLVDNYYEDKIESMRSSRNRARAGLNSNGEIQGRRYR